MNEKLDDYFPLCKQYNSDLFNEVQHCYLIMTEVSNKMNVPLEEMLEFFYKGKLKLELIKEQEEVLQNYGCERNETLQEVQQDDGRG